jgi:hypothetical protein
LRIERDYQSFIQSRVDTVHYRRRKSAKTSPHAVKAIGQVTGSGTATNEKLS